MPTQQRRGRHDQPVPTPGRKEARQRRDVSSGRPRLWPTEFDWRDGLSGYELLAQVVEAVDLAAQVGRDLAYRIGLDRDPFDLFVW